MGNEEILHRVKEEEYPTEIKKGRITGLDSTCIAVAF